MDATWMTTLWKARKGYGSTKKIYPLPISSANTFTMVTYVAIRITVLVLATSKVTENLLMNPSVMAIFARKSSRGKSKSDPTTR